VQARAEDLDLVLGGAELAVQLGELAGVLGGAALGRGQEVGAEPIDNLGVLGAAWCWAVAVSRRIRSSSAWRSVRSAASAASHAASSVRWSSTRLRRCARSSSRAESRARRVAVTRLRPSRPGRPLHSPGKPLLLGWGGSMAVVDPERDLTVVYVMNRMGPDILGSDRSSEYLEIVYRHADWLVPAGSHATEETS
jgi:CubicO group peptidase (beta-lactamase class C family)